MKNKKTVGLRRVGTSVVMTLPVGILDELGWEDGEQVELKVMGWAGDLHLIVERAGNNEVMSIVGGE